MAISIARNVMVQERKSASIAMAEGIVWDAMAPRYARPVMVILNARRAEAMDIVPHALTATASAKTVQVPAR